ncbi:MAG: hypothetical protein IKU44_04510 [Firmicutes bacterium]|nr:hypothetical protein [Bacillota bacterium]
MLFKTMRPFLAPDDGLGGGTGAEVQEIADPVVEESGEEVQEFAEPATGGRTQADSAFAELRRRAEEAERQRAEYETQNKQMIEALGLYFDGDNATDLAIAARANAKQISPAEERAQYEAEQERMSMADENKRLHEENIALRVEQRMAKDLSEIQKIDPDVKSLEDLGETFANYIRAGLSSVDAYYAVKAREAKEKVVPPKTVGKVATSKGESSFFTREEVEAMSDEDIDKNFENIMASQKQWK